MIILNQSCDTENCNSSCFTDPNPFQFEIIDKTTGENLFTNGTFDPKDISVINISDNSRLEHSFINENELNIIIIHSIGWKTEKVECSLKINDSELLTLFVDAKRVNENCCSFTRYQEIRIENAEYELNNQTEIYKILID